MQNRTLPSRTGTILALLLTIFAALAIALNSATAQAPTGGTEIERPHDPAVINGADLPAFLNQPISTLSLYAYDGVTWRAIPFQVDEVDSLGNFVLPGTDDDDAGAALLDANDQLVFMGFDAGSATSCTESLNLVPSAHQRQAISVIDSLTDERNAAPALTANALRATTGTVYLYQNLPLTPTQYVQWDEATQTINGAFNSSYRAKIWRP